MNLPAILASSFPAVSFGGMLMWLIVIAAICLVLWGLIALIQWATANPSVPQPVRIILYVFVGLLLLGLMAKFLVPLL